MSSASSVASSPPDSPVGSYISPPHIHDPRASGLSLGSRSGASEDGGDHDRDRDPTASPEPLFNFRSLAAVVGVTLEGEHAGRRLSTIEAERLSRGEAGAAFACRSPLYDSSKADEADIFAEVETVEDAGVEHGAVAPTDRNRNSQFDESRSASPDSDHVGPPKVTITSETAALDDDIDDESKQLGCEARIVARLNQVTQ
jgi:hypothetical protein